MSSALPSFAFRLYLSAVSAFSFVSPLTYQDHGVRMWSGGPGPLVHPSDASGVGMYKFDGATGGS